MPASSLPRRPLVGLGAALALSAAFAWTPFTHAASGAVTLPPPATTGPTPTGDALQSAVLAGGCFWGIEAVYQHLDGVTEVVSGYSGGEAATADYRLVSTGRTEHAEVVRITYDPRQVSYAQLLQVFFSVAHDPTQLDRQGPDRGRQYRSAIFYADETQQRVAEAYIDQLDAAGVFDQPIVTRLDPLNAFYPAEDYHQDYAYHHPNQPYIVFNDLPKVANLERLFPGDYRDSPVLDTAR
ncbi:peptide-methionine (S)-S-oxide reductase MsrA [Halomonas nitroreducens]|uniref:Peptide methionine sulfoxide reductase MsrA n=1 Tax=Halomonas nitroreducens TaxID=447425 RepID=A0A3S0QYP8_9GAMM|nr:peptide-methionine (S)-S-oxide reductase MsrA [Halomonas nitroreducens]RTQ97824.1 peptide-methionine (S)-S-oxide reductase [Halomonas nitroreducens]